MFYVGETASVHKRLSQHQRTYSDFATVRALVVELNLPLVSVSDEPSSTTNASSISSYHNRSLSRLVETILILQLKLKFNVDICNDGAEERRKLF